MTRHDLVLPLERRPGIVDSLRGEGKYVGYPGDVFAKPINDERYPTTESGLVEVKFSVIPGEEFGTPKTYYNQDTGETTELRELGVCCGVVRRRFNRMGIRFCKADEALLLFARDPDFNPTRRYVAFIDSTEVCFTVWSNPDGSRCLAEVIIHLDFDTDIEVVGVRL